MRAIWSLVLLGLVACGGSEVGAACPTAVELAEADDGCDCVGVPYVIANSDEVCSCDDEGIVCAPAEETNDCRRGIDCGGSGSGR